MAQFIARTPAAARTFLQNIFSTMSAKSRLAVAELYLVIPAYFLVVMPPSNLPIARGQVQANFG